MIHIETKAVHPHKHWIRFELEDLSQRSISFIWYTRNLTWKNNYEWRCISYWKGDFPMFRGINSAPKILTKLTPAPAPPPQKKNWKNIRLTNGCKVLWPRMLRMVGRTLHSNYPLLYHSLESFLDLSTTYLHLRNKGTKYLEDRSSWSSSTVW